MHGVWAVRRVLVPMALLHPQSRQTQALLHHQPDQGGKGGDQPLSIRHVEEDPHHLRLLALPTVPKPLRALGVVFLLYLMGEFDRTVVNVTLIPGIARQPHRDFRVLTISLGHQFPIESDC